MLAEAAENEENKLNLEDKDSITAYLRKTVSPADEYGICSIRRKADMVGRGAGREGKEGMEEGTRGEYKGYDVAVDKAQGELPRTR